MYVCILCMYGFSCDRPRFEARVDTASATPTTRKDEHQRTPILTQDRSQRRLLGYPSGQRTCFSPATSSPKRPLLLLPLAQDEGDPAGVHAIPMRERRLLRLAVGQRKAFMNPPVVIGSARTLPHAARRIARERGRKALKGVLSTRKAGLMLMLRGARKKGLFSRNPLRRSCFCTRASSAG